MESDFQVSFPGLGIFNIAIDRVAFSIFGVDVYWYGLLISLACLLCLYLAYRQAPKFNLEQEFVIDNFIGILISMMIGARAYYVIFNWQEFQGDLTKIFDVRQGGLAFYGGVFGAVIGIYIVHKLQGYKSAEPFCDFAVVYLPLGQAIGRLGNFMNQEAFGVNTTLPWGMISNGTTAYLAAHPELGQDPNMPVHPTFLYEFIGNLIIFAVLFRARKKNKYALGSVALYCITYGLLRFFVEGLRTDSLYLGTTSIRISQLVSLIMVVVGVFYLVYAHNKYQALVSDAEATAEGEEELLPLAFRSLAERAQAVKPELVAKDEEEDEEDLAAEEEEEGLDTEEEEAEELAPEDEEVALVEEESTDSAEDLALAAEDEEKSKEESRKKESSQDKQEAEALEKKEDLQAE